MSSIRDVAQEAGVAVGTVSRYFNGAKLKEANRASIEKAIAKLDFTINPMARGLKTSKSATIGVIIPDLGEVYDGLLVKNIEKKLFEFGFNTIICDTQDDPLVEKAKVELLLQRFVDGLIIDPASEHLLYLDAIKARNIPFVLIDSGTKEVECDQVIVDNDNATYSAMELLISKRHRRIGLITGPHEKFTARERLRGYRRALDDYSIKEEPELVLAIGYREKDGYEGMKSLMKLPNPPTAVLASNYQTTIGAIKAIYELGIDFPQDLSFVGFDNIGFTELIRPPLTIVTQPIEEIGQQAAELLIRRINGEWTDFPTIIRLKTSLIERKSERVL